MRLLARMYSSTKYLQNIKAFLVADAILHRNNRFLNGSLDISGVYNNKDQMYVIGVYRRITETDLYGVLIIWMVE